MQILGRSSTAEPVSSFDGWYGMTNSTLAALKAWDGDAIFGCLCDSSWPVGLVSHHHRPPPPTGSALHDSARALLPRQGMNETQVSEWFGPVCSFRRCPSGDDPNTQYNETDCSGMHAATARAPLHLLAPIARPFFRA